ncbi:MAG: PfkB family carbohydrate kinase [Opitutaceae bacterium]|jgi:sugar/nucleoside kinase (ribokinase family)|nr:PfkB family carbohydrate kinase [Opitutaceae bacterium]
MNFKTRAIAALEKNGALLARKSAVVGFDGFVDTLVTPVALRKAQGDAFTPIETIEAFGRRIIAAAGKSTNIELYPRMDKLGGNGPIMANAILAAGARLTYIGALGAPDIHPVFRDFAARATVHSLVNPAHTIAVEFDDGKLMLGQMRSLDEITYERVIGAVGGDTLVRTLAEADLVSLVNWTMIPNATALFRGIVENVLPKLPPRERVFFFDLADPEKRSKEDLLEVLGLVSRFEAFGRVTFGLNLKEAQQVDAALGFATTRADEAGLRQMASDIREKLRVSTVVVHPKESAACATADGRTAWIPGPYVEKPLITTGAGDHFNAGFCNAQLLGLQPEECLATGVCTSGHYVRTGVSPDVPAIIALLGSWN